MNTTLKLEEFAMFLLSLLLFLWLDYSWWIFVLFFFLPDISMLGYLKNAQTGAIFYNLFHHKGIAIVLWISGYFLQNPELQFAGIILLGHASFDRIFGYGLKYPDSFHNTHLGRIGKNSDG